MELPSPDQQTTLYGLLGFIGTGLMAIARAFFKFINAYIEKIKAEAKQEGVVLAKLEHLDEGFKELKDDIDGIAQSLVRQGLSLQKKPKQTKDKQNENPID